MKRIIATSALALVVLSGAASAMTASSINEATIRGYAPTADVSQLSDKTVSQILGVIHGGDSEGEKRVSVRSLLMNAS